MQVWFLEGYLGQGKSLKRLRVSPVPFRMGRQEDLQLPLDSAGISRIHAEFDISGRSLILRDLGSTNGTYVNRERLSEPRRVQHGDIIHLADMEFRVIEQDLREGNDAMGSTRIGISTLSSKLPAGAREFQQLMLKAQVTGVFQPIVDRDVNLHAYELLGRGANADLPDAPGPLFRLAESLDLEVAFSELLRSTGLAIAADKAPDALHFFNIHPLEMKQPGRLMQTLEQFRNLHPRLKCVLEVHEGAVTDAEEMRNIRSLLTDMNIGLAYDDFGAGQARLVELTEVPPDYVKFDMALIRDLDQASNAKRDMIKLLVNFVRDLGIQALAEGIAREGEADICHELGFDLFQGFYFGTPDPLP